MSIVSKLCDLLVRKIDPAISNLYQACVTAARQPVFYARYGVPDTIDGRFDLLLLHITLVMLRLGNITTKQKLFNLMFADMDRSLREMGVGDMSIGKKMKPMLAGFYGRTGAYHNALQQPDVAKLIAAVSRNLYNDASGNAPHAPAIAQYMRDAAATLQNQSEAAIMQGQISFPSMT
jgi:cytochrome b pre-mRNA-processing protein 3